MASSRPAHGQQTRGASLPMARSQAQYQALHIPKRVPATTTTPTTPQRMPVRSPGGWNLDSLSGRFLEISSAGPAVSLTAAASLILEAQLRGEPAAWVATGDSTFFPPDFAASGIDLGALPVIRVSNMLTASRAGETLLRSGGFGIVVLDLGRDIDMRIAVQARLAALAKKHRTILLCLTQKDPSLPSLGPLVSLRVQGALHKTGFNRFTWELDILRDKRHGLRWGHMEVCRGPDGLC